MAATVTARADDGQQNATGQRGKHQHVWQRFGQTVEVHAQPTRADFCRRVTRIQQPAATQFP